MSYSSSHQPYRKPNSHPKYIHVDSKHPKCIIEQVPKMVNDRLSMLSSGKKEFDESRDIYQQALNDAGHKFKLEYKPPSNATNDTRKHRRKRNITWYNLPFNMNVKTKVGMLTLKLIDKHFPKNNELNKIFNRNTIKISYCTMKNMRSSIIGMNKKKLECADSQNPNSKCFHNEQNPCPVDGRCKEEAVIYKATVCIDGEPEDTTKTYLGLSEPPFHERLRGHRKSFTNKKYSAETELSKYIWRLKEKRKSFSIKWQIIKKCRKYKPGSWYCHLCTSEKHLILMEDSTKCLNKRSELVSKCRHKRKFLLERYLNDNEDGKPKTQKKRDCVVNITPLQATQIIRPCRIVIKRLDPHLNRKKTPIVLKRSTRIRKKRNILDL